MNVKTSQDETPRAKLFFTYGFKDSVNILKIHYSLSPFYLIFALNENQGS
jgi:hypothetical protein